MEGVKWRPPRATCQIGRRIIWAPCEHGGRGGKLGGGDGRAHQAADRHATYVCAQCASVARPPAAESKSLDDLVSAGYLHALPVDPITGAKDWVTVSSDVLLDPDEASGGGISDVHSSSDQVSQLKALRAVRGK